MDRHFTFQPPPKRRQKPDHNRKHGFIQPRNVEDYWNFYKKGMTTAKPVHGIPAWLLPLLALLLMITLIFWAAPAAINRIKSLISAENSQGSEPVSLLYDDSTWTVNKPVADVFDRDDIKAARLTQGLFNEPVRILSRDCAYGFVKVRLEDGLEGFMFEKDLIDSRVSIEPGLFSNKLVVASATKRIMSHASRGTLLAEVMMGTVLYADYRRNGLSRVMLPDGGAGWVSDDGVIILEPMEEVRQPDNPARYFCSSAMAFNQITVLDNGQSVRGISTVGIARLAAAVNGVTLPRTLPGIAMSGENVPLSVDEESGLVQLDQVQAGDLVFFSSRKNPQQPGDLAICTGSNMILYARPGQSAIRLLDMTQNEDLWRQILMVRRLFSPVGE